MPVPVPGRFLSGEGGGVTQTGGVTVPSVRSIPRLGVGVGVVVGTAVVEDCGLHAGVTVEVGFVGLHHSHGGVGAGGRVSGTVTRYP